MTKRLKIPAPPQKTRSIDGRFKIVGEIGKGASGTVYKGIQLSVERPVAIKILHPSYSVRDDFQARFSREAKAIARLSHTNCITLYDFGMSDEFESLFMVTEFVEGRELFEVMEEPVPLRKALEYVIQIAGAMEHAHSHNILHRDLKPENVLITDDDVVKVLDFGMARIVDELASQNAGRLTEQGAVYGTPAYMSPEQCQGNLDVSEQTDLYSLGVVLYELVEGRLPFESPQIMKILSMHVNDAAPPITADVPDRLKALILSMMAKRQVERPSSAAIVADTLRSILLEIPDGDAQRDTLDASQEIKRTLLQFDESNQTGEGIRSTIEGLDQADSDDGADVAKANEGEAGEEAVDPSPPPPSAKPPAPLEATDPSRRAAHQTWDVEVGSFRRSWTTPLTVAAVFLVVAALVGGKFLMSDEGVAPRDEETPSGDQVAAEGPGEIEDSVEAATPDSDDEAEPAAPVDEVVESPAADEPTTEEHEAATKARDSKPIRKTAPTPKPADKPKPTRKPKSIEATSNGPPQEDSAESAENVGTEDGEEAGESGTMEADESEDKLPTIRFTY